MGHMGTYDTIRDGDREIQVKCLGKSLRELSAGDTVTLHVMPDYDEQLSLAAQVDALEATLGPRSDTVAEIVEHGRALTGNDAYQALMRGRPVATGDYQIALSDGTHVTVRDHAIVGVADTRDETVPVVDNGGRPYIGTPHSAAWVCD